LDNGSPKITPQVVIFKAIVFSHSRATGSSLILKMGHWNQVRFRLTVFYC